MIRWNNWQGWVVILVAALLQAGPLAAETGRSLYEYSAAVADQGGAARARASAEGLRAVLVRVSGQRDPGENERLRHALRNAESFLDQYRYERAEAVEGGQPWRLRLQFNATQVNALLREAGLPLWPANRPVTLVWLLVDDGREQQFASPETTPELVDALRVGARERGLELRFPLFDLTDSLAVSTDDLWQLRLDVVEDAAARYPVDALLSGRLSRLSSGRWLGSWHYSFGGDRIAFEGDGADLAGYVTPAVERIADHLAARFAIVPVGLAEGGLILEIEGVDDFLAYAGILEYLDGLAAVRRAQPVSVQQRHMRLQLIIDGTVEQLQNVLALDRRLQPATGYWTRGGDDPAVLHYRWQTARPARASE